MSLSADMKQLRFKIAGFKYLNFSAPNDIETQVC